MFDTSKTSEEVLVNFSKYFDGAKICLNQSGDCRKYTYSVLYNSPVYGVENNALNDRFGYPLMILKDGSTIMVVQYSTCEEDTLYPTYNPDGTIKVDSDGNVVKVPGKRKFCAEIKFDTNGYSKPNQYGADTFTFMIDSDATFIGFKTSGFTSLKGILSGQDPEYTKYTSGSKKE